MFCFVWGFGALGPLQGLFLLYAQGSFLVVLEDCEGIKPGLVSALTTVLFLWCKEIFLGGKRWEQGEERKCTVIGLAFSGPWLCPWHHI